MRTSKLVWVRTPLMLALLVITLGLIVISSETAAENNAPGVEDTDIGEEVEEVDPLSVNGNCCAAINTAGVRVRSSCTVSSSRITTGQYQVFFNRSLSNCWFLATIGRVSAGTEVSGQISTALRVGTANGVFVNTTNSSGTNSDRGFQLCIFCR